MDVSNDTITPRTLIRGYMDNNDTVATSTPRMLRSHQHAGLDNDSKHSPQSMLLSNEQQKSQPVRRQSSRKRQLQSPQGSPSKHRRSSLGGNRLLKQATMRNMAQQQDSILDGPTPRTLLRNVVQNDDSIKTSFVSHHTYTALQAQAASPHVENKSTSEESFLAASQQSKPHTMNQSLKYISNKPRLKIHREQPTESITEEMTDLTPESSGINTQSLHERSQRELSETSHHKTIQRDYSSTSVTEDSFLAASQKSKPLLMDQSLKYISHKPRMRIHRGNASDYSLSATSTIYEDDSDEQEHSLQGSPKNNKLTRLSHSAEFTLLSPEHNSYTEVSSHVAHANRRGSLNTGNREEFTGRYSDGLVTSASLTKSSSRDIDRSIRVKQASDTPSLIEHIHVNRSLRLQQKKSTLSPVKSPDNLADNDDESLASDPEIEHGVQNTHDSDQEIANSSRLSDSYVHQQSMQSTIRRSPRISRLSSNKSREPSLHEASLRKSSVHELTVREQSSREASLYETSLHETSLHKISLHRLSVRKPSIGEPSIAEPSIHKTSLHRLSVRKPSIGEPSIGEPSIGEPSIHKTSIAEPSIHKTSIAEPSIHKTSLHRSSVRKPSIHKTSLHETSSRETSLHKTSLREPSLPGLSVQDKSRRSLRTTHNSSGVTNVSHKSSYTAADDVDVPRDAMIPSTRLSHRRSSKNNDEQEFSINKHKHHSSTEKNVLRRSGQHLREDNSSRQLSNMSLTHVSEGTTDHSDGNSVQTNSVQFSTRHVTKDSDSGQDADAEQEAESEQEDEFEHDLNAEQEADSERDLNAEQEAESEHEFNTEQVGDSEQDAERDAEHDADSEQDADAEQELYMSDEAEFTSYQKLQSIENKYPQQRRSSSQLTLDLFMPGSRHNSGRKSDSLTLSGRKGGSLGSRKSGSLGSRQSGSLGSRQSGSLGSRQSGSLGSRQSGSLGSRQSGSLGSRESGSLRSRKSHSFWSRKSDSVKREKSGDLPHLDNGNRRSSRGRSRPSTLSNASRMLSTHFQPAEESSHTRTSRQSRDAPKAADITEANTAEDAATAQTRQNHKRVQRKGRLPAKITKSVFERFAGRTINKETLEAVEEAADEFWQNLFLDAEACAQHGGRKVIDETDMFLILRRQGVITDYNSYMAVCEKHLPVNMRAQMIPCAEAYNKVYPK